MGRGLAAKTRRPTARKRRLAVAAMLFALLMTPIALASCADGGASARAWSLAAPTRDGDAFVLQLSDAQRRDSATASYTVIRRYPQGDASYYPVVAGVPTTIDESGRITIPADPKVLEAIVDGGKKSMLCGVDFASEDDASLHYTTDNFRLLTAADYSASGIASGYGDATLAATVDKQTGDVDVTISRRVEPYPQGTDVGPDQLASYHAIGYSWRQSMGKTRADDGSMMPIAQWEKTGFASGSQCSYDDSVDFAMAPVSSTGEECLVQVAVTDSAGAVHASELAPIEVFGPWPGDGADVEVPTDHGKLAFDLHDDHAELVGYEGEDTDLAVPAKVEGLPVTEVGPDAFESDQFVQSVKLPGCVAAIGNNAFRNSHIRSFDVPASLKKIGEYAFSGTKTLATFTQSDEGKHTSVRDGVLYSADGATLLAYPPAKGGDFTVPDGVETIGFSAFAESDVRHVTLPDSLRAIEPCAFYGCINLAAPALPARLERIGDAAFGALYVNDSLIDEDAASNRPTAIRVGRNVSFVGKAAFGALGLEAIEVAGGNKLYRSAGGFLLSKDGTLLEAPAGLQGAIEVPEGVTSLAEGVLGDFKGIQHEDGSIDLIDVFLPASLARIGDNALPTRNEFSDASLSTKLECGARLHAPAGSWAESYAQEQGIEHDNLRSAADLRWTTATVELPKATLTFRAYPDHAALVGIAANEAGHVAVPDEVEGVPVTAIGADMNDEASGIVKTLIIPAHVERIEGTLLSKVSGLRKYEVDGRNGQFSIREGSLCNADGTLLVAYPRERGTTYAVPQGVTEIGPSAFQNATIEEVTLPDGLQRIGSSAFESCFNLRAIGFPASLEHIGTDAFGGVKSLDLTFAEGLATISKDAFSGLTECDEVAIPDSVKVVGEKAFGNYGDDKVAVASKTVKIGSGLEELGNGAFCKLDIESFAVSGSNPHFKADGPFLLSKDGRKLYAYASGAGPVAHVPDGVEEICTYAFDGTAGITEAYLPASLLRMSSMAFDIVDKSAVTLHCPPGSEAALMARSQGFACVEE